MKSPRMVWILVAAVVFFAASLYFASQKRRQLATHPPAEKISLPPQGPATGAVGVGTTSPAPENPAQALGTSNPAGNMTQNQPGMANGGGSETNPSPVPTPCHAMPEYFQLRRQLGRLVNNDALRHDRAGFLKSIGEFRAQYGLPFPMTTLPTNKLEEEGVVYNNCHPTCKGMVNEVFVSRIVQNRFVEVYTKKGVLKQLPLHDSGLDVSTVDELNRKGVPFRSWRVPTLDTDWYVVGNTLYYAMDIQGLWLQVDTVGHWNIVTKPSGLAKLEAVEPAVKVAGCVPDENCLQVKASSHSRYFKAPKACAAVLSHSADEPVDHDQDGQGTAPATRPSSPASRAGPGSTMPAPAPATPSEE